MTREYAKLSIRAGCLAATIQAATGQPAINFFRARASAFTPELLEEVKRAVVEQGVPQDLLDQAELEATNLMENTGLIDEYLSLQDRIDRAGRQ